MKKILLTGGGTAGHITPNIALLPYLRNFDIHYAGAPDSMEKQLISGYPFVTFHEISCVKLVRGFSPKNVAIPFKLLKGINQSKKLLKELEPTVIFSKGGFASLPVMLAAGKKFPLILHESDFSMGLANKMGSKNCKYICTSFLSLSEQFDNGIYTGTPLRQEIYYGNKSIALLQSGLCENGKPNLLIMGGSQGAEAINQAIFSAVNELTAYFNVVHIVGKKNEHKLSHSSYCQIAYCTNISDYFKWADFAVSRGGANAIAELVALKKPSLIIPLPKGNSRGDQEDNAKYYKDLGCINVLAQEKLTGGTLMSELLQLKKDAEKLVKAIYAAPSSDGTRKIATLLNSYR